MIGIVMNKPLLSVQNLQTFLPVNNQPVAIVDDISFDLFAGKTLALVGESGSGKSMTALSLLQLVPESASFGSQSKVIFNDSNLLDFSDAEMMSVRGKQIAMVFQEPMTALNPVLSIGEQLIEVIRKHTDCPSNEFMLRAAQLLNSVGISDPHLRVDNYPHELSGGMRQRVMIAMAIAAKPALLIADELTTALDLTIQAQILTLLKNIQQETGMAILLITHDLGIVAQMADDVAVMYAGHLIEKSTVKEFFAEPAHPYSKQLFSAIPQLSQRDYFLNAIPGQVPSLNQTFSLCRFLPRCKMSVAICQQQLPPWYTNELHSTRCHLAFNTLKQEIVLVPLPSLPSKQADENAVLKTQNLKVYFPIKKGLLKRTVGYVKAVDDISIHLKPAKTLAIVGESGCGKTTLAKAVLRLIPEAKGDIYWQDVAVGKMKQQESNKYRKLIQLVFQDPFSSLNPRMQVAEIISEGLLIYRKLSAIELAKEVDKLLLEVGLLPEYKSAYPHEFSGGQRQRVAIARALSVSPQVVICDEPTSALDVSVQAQILNLLKRLQQQQQVSYLFISHNMAVVGYMADHVAVMYLGRIVEYGDVNDVLTFPKHPYTQALLSSIPDIVPSKKKIEPVTFTEIPSPSSPPSGCHFHPRCPFAMDICKKQYPPIYHADNQQVNCYLYRGP